MKKQFLQWPIFIGGVSRSGTTLLGSILGTNTNCLTIPEAQFVMDIYFSDVGGSTSFDVFHTLDLIRNHWRFKIWEMNLETDQLSEEGICDSYPELIRWIVRQYGIKNSKPNAKIWVDHTPTNTWYVATLLHLFPNAKFIHIVRDGRAVALSNKTVTWGHVTVDGTAHEWLERLSYGLAAEQFLGPERMMRVKYEDVIQRPTTTIKDICAFIGIEYRSEMLAGDGFIPPQYTLHQHVLVGKPLNTDRIDAWRKDLTPREIEIFESITCDMLEFLGYPLEYRLHRKKMTSMEKIISMIKQLVIGRIVNRFRTWRRIRRSVAHSSRK